MMTPATLRDMHRHCPCGCRSLDRARPGWYRELPADVRAVHDAWTRRELLLWDACVWRPESAESAAAVRQVALATVRLLASLRAPLRRAWAAATAAAGALLGPGRRELATCGDRAPPLWVRTGGPLASPP